MTYLQVIDHIHGLSPAFGTMSSAWLQCMGAHFASEMRCFDAPDFCYRL